MQSDLVELGWTEDQWNRISSTVLEEAQKARVVAQVLPAVGPEEGSTVAIPNFTLIPQVTPFPYPPGAAPPPPPPPAVQGLERLWVDSDPTLAITTIAVNVQLRSHEAADPDLKAALVMFRRAANYIAHIEDAVAFNGRPGPAMPPIGIAGIPNVYSVTGSGAPPGIFLPPLPPPGRITPPYGAIPSPPTNGDEVFQQIIAAINLLEGAGQTGPYACVLSHQLFEYMCTPVTGSFVLPRDRVLPFLQGPLLRSSQIANPNGCVLALGGSPIELVVASDISVRFLQATLEPRYVFRVSERIALRIKESQAIGLLG
jgi:uncharacterized linocin/CFP29 family protein